MPSLYDSSLEKIFARDREILKTTKIPIVTVSGTFREDLKHWHGVPDENISTDIVFSRAHFSMAFGAAQAIWGDKVDSKSAWLVDPTNYVRSNQWRSILFTEDIGQLLARVPILKLAKDLIDRFGRSKLPILDSITPPLLYLFEEVHQPILSFHIAAGNILAKLGKNVVQVITDPHVREDYLENAQLPNIRFCVFDEETKFDALEKAFLSGIELDPDRVIVTGPPIDPRIIELRNQTKKPAHASSHAGTADKPLNLLITTGGLGTNKQEIRQILELLLPELRRRNPRAHVMLYAGTQHDFVTMAETLAHREKIKVTTLTSKDSTKKLLPGEFSIIYHPQLFDANELLIQHGFPWADGVITKPSGDMAYDAAAAGCFLLTLKPWGVWEERIEDIFWQKGIARKAEPAKILEQLDILKESGWIAGAREAAIGLEPLYLNGLKQIIKVVKQAA